MIYAKQIAPEYQESPINWTDEYPEGVILDGNRHYNSHTTPEYETIKSNFEDMAGEIRNFEADQDCSAYDSIAEIVADYMQGREWTPKQLEKWAKLAREYDELDDIMLEALELMTGNAYDDTTIRGCCQGDWQNMYYPASYGREFVKTFEMEYFNMGSEWIIHDEDTAPEDADDITGYGTYCYSYHEDDIKKEIAATAGGAPEDVTLYVFERWTRSEVYRIA